MTERFVIVRMTPTYGRLVLAIVGSGLLVAASSQQGSGIDISDVGSFVVGLAALVLFVFTSALLLSNVMSGWAVLVGDGRCVQVVYPFGVHRLIPSSRLCLGSTRARLTESDRLGGNVVDFAVEAAEGELTFSVRKSLLAEGSAERFDRWIYESVK